MKKILEFLKKWFEKNGVIKIIVTFIIIFISIILAKAEILPGLFSWIAIISIGYLVLTFLIFIVAAIINTFRKK